MKTATKPLAKPAFLESPRCGAKTRKGKSCQAPAMKNGRCRMHGGQSTGPPKGTQNALKHGYYTRAAIAERKRVSRLIRDSRAFLDEI
jgi:hypothetical protein